MKESEYIRVTTSIPLEVKRMAKKEHIQLNTALTSGVYFLTERNKMFERIEALDKRQTEFEARHRSDVRLLRQFMFDMIKEQNEKQEKKG